MGIVLTGHTDLEGKTALVTGAGRGLGRACASALAEAGARVIAVSRTSADLDALAAAHPGRITPWVLDVTAREFTTRVAVLDTLDILLNNAGINYPKRLIEVDEATLDAMLTVNVRSVYLGSQAAVRAMARHGRGGSIIHMSSQMGHVGAPNRTVYCMTKHAIEGLTKAMGVELGPLGIRVNSIAPTFIETDLTRPMLAEPTFREEVLGSIPLGRLGRPEDITGAVLFLASAQSALMTGTSLRIDGGWTAR